MEPSLASMGLALSVSVDAAVSLSLVLLAVDGPLWPALFPPLSYPPQVRLAFGPGDLLVLTAVRAALALAPVLGTAGAGPAASGGGGLVRWGLPLGALANAGVTALLGLKAAAALQLSAPELDVLVDPEAGVTLSVPRLLAGEIWGIIAAWALYGAAFVNWNELQPLGGDSDVGRSDGGGWESGGGSGQRASDVQRWLDNADVESGGGGGGIRGFLGVSLLGSGSGRARARARAAAAAAAACDDAGESFLSAESAPNSFHTAASRDDSLLMSSADSAPAGSGRG